MLTIPPALSAPESTDSRLFHLGVLAALLLLSYLSFVGVFTSLFELIVNAHIEEVARAYIKTTVHQTTRTLDILSVIKAVLALLQSSDGGISFPSIELHQNTCWVLGFMMR